MSDITASKEELLEALMTILYKNHRGEWCIGVNGDECVDEMIPASVVQALDDEYPYFEQRS